MLSGGNKGHLISLEFSSKTKCEKALSESKQKLDTNYANNVQFVCLEK
jgi:hypothetical protein